MDRDLREEARLRRAPLREAASSLEFAIAAPVGTGQVWRERVLKGLSDMADALESHVVQTEASDGLFEDLLEDAPQLSNLIDLLVKEHETIREEINSAVAAVGDLPDKIDDDCCEHVREAVLAMLGRISRHRQKGADLIWRAYSVDIGGE